MFRLTRHKTSAMCTSCPSWMSLQGDKRILAEYKFIQQQISSGRLKQLSDLEMVGDNILKWRVKARDFDNDQPGGRALNQDLQQLKRKHGQDFVLFEISFPNNYPAAPFMIRVVSPRCVWYTGHVTAGGSVCIEALTLSGSPGSWQATYSVEGILIVVLANMIDCEVYYVQTASGPGGLTGPLRIDLHHRYSSDVMCPYSEGEAHAAFQRMEQHHRRYGWGNPQN